MEKGTADSETLVESTKWARNQLQQRHNRYFKKQNRNKTKGSEYFSKTDAVELFILPSSSGSLAREQGGEVGEGASPLSVSALGDNTIDSATKGSSTGTGVVE